MRAYSLLILSLLICTQAFATETRYALGLEAGNTFGEYFSDPIQYEFSVPTIGVRFAIQKEKTFSSISTELAYGTSDAYDYEETTRFQASMKTGYRLDKKFDAYFGFFYTYANMYSGNSFGNDEVFNWTIGPYIGVSKQIHFYVPWKFSAAYGISYSQTDIYNNEYESDTNDVSDLEETFSSHISLSLSSGWRISESWALGWTVLYRDNSFGFITERTLYDSFYTIKYNVYTSYLF